MDGRWSTEEVTVYRLYLDGVPIVDTRGHAVLYPTRAQAEFTAEHWGEMGGVSLLDIRDSELAARTARLRILEEERARL